MFRIIGYGDNIGSGFQKILAAWKSLGFKRPRLEELDDVNEVWLTLTLVESNESVSTENSPVSDGVNEGVNDNVNDSVNDSVNDGVNSNDSVNDGVNVTVNVGVNVGVNSRETSDVKLTERQTIMVSVIKSNPMVTAKQMSETLSVTVRTIERDLALMQKAGIIRHEGSDKTGVWVILEQGNTNS